MDGGTLSAVCLNFFGAKQNTSLVDADKCAAAKHDIENINGSLRCVISSLPIGSEDPYTADIISISSDVKTATDETKVIRIDQPRVDVATDEYRSITFQPGDTIVLTAGNCVQTGGFGLTWKSYVHPQGDSADTYYSGTAWIPTVTGAGLARLAGLVNKTWTVPNDPAEKSELFLTLGYQDQAGDYGDNGYWGHDDGNNNQCQNVGPAWLEVKVVSKVGSKNSAPEVRMRWQDFISGPDGAKRLASLQAAVKKMKSLNNSPKDSADYRRSWEYWANIHGYYGAKSPDGTVAEHIQELTSHGMAGDASYYQGINDQLPPDSIAQTIWATCQHSGSQQDQALNFFGWHRMFIYYYERVLRWAAGDDSLRLPYWDYTDPAQVALPSEFRNTASTLYDSRRDTDMNTGASTLNPDTTDVDSLLGETAYFTYEYNVEENIHGYVHCTTGPDCPVAHMGDVPVAGNDPIFYSHHANIDRLWACWQHLHPTPAGTWQDQQFSFVDETGTMQTKPVKNFLDSTTLGYVYDNESHCTRTATAKFVSKPLAEQAAPTTGEKKMTVLGGAQKIAINHPQTTVDINLPEPTLRALFTQPEGAPRTELVLTDVTAESTPGVLFDVYLATKSDPTVRKLAGTISWFGAFHHHGQAGPSKRTLRYDVTDQLRALGAAANTSGLTVVIEATHGRVPADKSKAEAVRADAAKSFRTQANLQIGAIELQQETPPAAP